MIKVILSFAVICMLFAPGEAFGQKNSVPTLKVGYIFTTHHIPFMVAMAKGESLKAGDTYMQVVVPKEKYALMSGGKKIANLDIIVAKSGAEVGTMFAMKRLDVALASVTAMTSAIDKGTPIKVLGPLHTDGMGLVFPTDSPVTNWDSLIAHIKASKRPVNIGYHSPTSAPKIVFEGALTKAGVRVSDNPTDPAAQVIMTDLKATSNFIPAMTSKQVDGYVAPAPFPEVAEVRGVGKIVVDLKDLPPKGHWNNFPCCVMAASDEVTASHPLVVRKFVELMEYAAEWSNPNKSEVATISASWLGVPEEAIRKASIVYTTKPTQNWMNGVGIYLDTQNRLNEFSGKLKGKKLKEVESTIFDFRFLTKK